MRTRNSRSTLQHARALRQELTAAERELWAKLRNRTLGGLKFRRQQPIGKYIVDFCCPEQAVIVEVDGAIHLGRERQDLIRQQWLESEGFRVLRFKNTQIHHEMEAVLEEILRVCECRK